MKQATLIEIGVYTRTKPVDSVFLGALIGYSNSW